LERKLADEEFNQLFVIMNFTEHDGSGLEAMRLLDQQQQQPKTAVRMST
jgi:hypothetical protein